MSKFNYLLLPVLLALVACGGGGGGGSGSASASFGSISVGITDGPVDKADEVSVTFTRLELKPKTGSSFFIDPNEPLTINLLDYQGNKRAMLVDRHRVATGEYNWLRLLVDDSASYIVVDGAQYPLEIPSGAQSGLKLNRGFTVGAGPVTDFTLDFDLRKSITATGQNPPRYKLRPTLRLVDNLQFNSISGTVADGLVNDPDNCNNGDNNDIGNVVYVYAGTDVQPQDVRGNDQDPLASATVNYRSGPDEYRFVVGFLPYEEGGSDYTLAFTCQAQDDEPDRADAIDFSDTVTVTVSAAETPPVHID